MLVEDTTIKLFDYLFKVKVPYLQSMSIDTLRLRGVHQSGVSSIDNSVDKEWLTSMMSVAKMTDYYKEGIPLKIPSYKDIVEIYDIITNHINAWKYQIQNSINVRAAPIEDLILLDRFANSVYDKAKYQFTNDAYTSILAQYLGGANKHNPRNFFKKEVVQKTDEDYAERDSLADFFKGRLITWNN